MIKIVAGVFTSAKDYLIDVEAGGYGVASVTQTINDTGLIPELKNPPTLNTTEKVVGQEIELTFADNADWRGNITRVSVGAKALSSEKYHVHTGKITIDAEEFDAAGSYTITVEARGYHNATVTQKINVGRSY